MNKDLVTHFQIKCAACGSDKAYQWYDKDYKGYIAHCPLCDDYWKMS